MKICFICNSVNETPFSEYIPLAKYLSGKGFDSFFILNRKHNKNIAARLNDSGITFYVDRKKFQNNYKLNTAEASTRISKKDFSRVLKRNIKKVFKKLIPQLLIECVYYDRFNKETIYNKNLVNHIFSKENPDGVVVYGDRGTGLIAGSILWARENNKPVFDLQIALNNIPFVLATRLGKLKFYVKNSFMNRRVAKKFPEQVQNTKEGDILFYPWYKVMVLNKQNALPSKPWYIGDSWATNKLLISDRQKSDSISEGGRSDHAVVVGQFSLDNLYEKYKNRTSLKIEMRSKYFPKGKEGEVLLFALPQFAEHAILKFDQALEEIDFILNLLSEFKELNILLSLHPKMSYERYAQFDQKYDNIRILKEERLSDAMPVSDYFMAAFESTITWALLCESIPVFLDYFKLNYDVSKYHSCVVVKEKDNLKQVLEKMIAEKVKWQGLIRKDQDKLPPFDGQSGERIYQIIKNTCNNG